MGAFTASGSSIEASFDNMGQVEYITLPSNHWIARLATSNPFKALNDSEIKLTRPSFWGYELFFLKEDNGTVLFKKGNQLRRPTYQPISSFKLQSIFGNFQQKLLGAGGQGSVYEISFGGQNYALKKGAQESFVLEKLQFTPAVIKTYASFMVGNEIYLVMEKAKQSLKAMNEAGLKLSDSQLLDAIRRINFLMSAEKKLNLINRDIKPDNIVIDNDNKLVVIDISEAQTRGYSGTEGELFARALLSNRIQQNLGTSGSMDKYYYHDEKARKGFASPYLVETWYREVCKRELNNDDTCSQIKSFEGLFSMFSPSKLEHIAQRINREYRDTSGTHDTDILSGYQTNLPYPQLKPKEQVDWQAFFERKDEIGRNFCANSSTPKHFEGPFFDKYKAFCQQKDRNWVFTKSFSGHQDPAFQEWILAAYQGMIMHQSLDYLGRTYALKIVYPPLFNEEINSRQGQEVGRALWDLYRAQP